MRLNLDALQTGRQTAADQFHEQVKLDFPVLARPGAGDTQKSRGPALDEISDDQNRADAEVCPERPVFGLIGARVAGIADLRDAQRGEPGFEPGQNLEGLAAQLLRVAGRQHAARRLHVDDARALGVQAHVEGGVGASRIAQQFQVGDDAFHRGFSRHGLEIDGDLGADDVEAHGRSDAASRPRVRGQYIRGAEVGMSRVVGCYRHAPLEVPGR